MHSVILAVSQMHSYNTSDNSDSDNSVEQGWQTLWGAETSQVSGGEGVTLATSPMTLHQQELDRNAEDAGDSCGDPEVGKMHLSLTSTCVRCRYMWIQCSSL